jgi:seryl-tRNA synthetase
MELPTNLMEWLGLIAIASVGILAVIGVFDKTRKGVRSETDKAETELIAVLKETVEALKEKIESYEVRIKKQDEKITEIKESFIRVEAENKTLKQVFQGIDKDSVKYREKGLKSMAKIDDIHQYMIPLIKEFNAHLAKQDKIEQEIIKKL